MAAILQVSRHLALDAMSFETGIYVIVEGEPKGGEVSRKEADKLLKAYPQVVKEFKDNEPIANLIEWKRQNTVIKS